MKEIKVFPSFINVNWYPKVYIIIKHTTSLNILEDKKYHEIKFSIWDYIAVSLSSKLKP